MNQVKYFFNFMLVNFVFLSCNDDKNYRHDEIVYVPSVDTLIEVKITYPDKWTKREKLIIWGQHPKEDVFMPDSVSKIHKRNVSMLPLLRQALLDSGFVNIEYIGRRDSVTYRNRKYSASDSNTNATDLESLLSYLQKNKILKNKKIILVGHSECGDVNAKVASKQHNNITAMVQLAARTISGNQFLEYQRESIGYFNFLVAFFDQQFFDKTINKYSSLDSYHTADIDGVKQFIRENLLPVEVFMDKYNDMDSIFYHVDMYLHERWQSESEEAKNALENDYNNYFKIFSAFITPQQITFRDIKYENYYPFIKCPVLAVCGTKDENIDCFPNIERMEKLLKDGGNTNFQKIILEDYKHNLAKWNGGGYIVEDSAIQKIVKWIDDQ